MTTEAFILVKSESRNFFQFEFLQCYTANHSKILPLEYAGLHCLYSVELFILSGCRPAEENQVQMMNMLTLQA